MRISPSPVPLTAIRQTDALTYRNWDVDTAEGRAFYGGGALTAGVGQYAGVQLLNPAASGKRVLIDRIFFSSPAAQAIGVYSYATALSGLVQQWANKLAGSPAGAAAIRSESLVAIVGGLLFQTYVSAGVQVPYELNRPIILPANRGVVTIGTVTNQALAAFFEGREL